ncbi:MAG: DUF5777 family beta-barrel protein [Syntrophales bacterium]
MKVKMMLLLIVLVSSAAWGEVLMTADPLGKDGCSLAVRYYKDSQANGTGFGDLNSWGASYGYAIDEKLDLFFAVDYSAKSGLPAGMDYSLVNLGLMTKYALLEEGASFPVSLSGNLGYRFLAVSSSLAGSATGSQYLAGVELSKKINYFTPYVGVDYRTISIGQGISTNQLGITLGTAYKLTDNGSVLLEYTSNSNSMAGTHLYSSSQLGMSLCYKM